MLTKSESKIIQDAHQSITMLGELVEQLKRENEQLRKKNETGEGPQESAAYDCLAVTNVQVWPFKEGPSLGHMKAIAKIVLNDQMVIHGLRIMEGENGLFVSYPFDPFYKGEEFRSVCNPITKQLREHIENCVLEKYQYTIS